MVWKRIKKLLKESSKVEDSKNLREIKYFSQYDYKNSIDNYINESHVLLSKEGHFLPHYRELRIKRIRKILQIYGLEWKGKKILELGSGYGDIGAFFAELGAEVLCVDGRINNVNFANLKYRHLDNFKSIVWDLEKDFTHLGEFDLIINFALIEVIENIDNLLECCTEMAKDVLVETIVTDTLDKDEKVYSDYDTNISDHSIKGRGLFPSPIFIEEFFEKRKFKTIRYFDSDLNTNHHKFDWKSKDDGKTRGWQRRFWLFKR